MNTIYEPRGRAREYSALACNLYAGCDHGCTYCYAPSCTFKKRQVFLDSKPRNGIIESIEQEAKNFTGTDERVLLCFTTDPYQNIDVECQLTRQTLQIFKRHNIPFQALSKGGYRALRDIDLFGNRDAFATTLTFTSNTGSLLWEPNAAMPNERIDTLRQFHEAGIYTWASLEPVIDTKQSLEVIKLAAPHVDLFKVGIINHHALTKTIDWRQFGIDAIQLLNNLHKPFFIKHDLMKWLPTEVKSQLKQPTTDFAPSLQPAFI